MGLYELTPEADEEVVNLRMICGYSSNAETIRHSLRLLQWFMEQTLQGNKIILLKSGEEHPKEITLPGLDLEGLNP